MQQLVAWWCGLIGVTDPGAVAVAAGIVAGGTLLFLGLAVLALLIGFARAS